MPPDRRRPQPDRCSSKPCCAGSPLVSRCPIAVANVTAQASAATTVMSAWRLRCGSSSAPSVVTPSRWTPRAANCTAMIQPRASRPNQGLFCGNCCWPAMLSAATACHAADWWVAHGASPSGRRPCRDKEALRGRRAVAPPIHRGRRGIATDYRGRPAECLPPSTNMISSAWDLPDCFRRRVRSLCHPLCHRPPAWSVREHPKHPGHAKRWEPQSAEGPVAGPLPHTMALHSMQKAVRVSRGAGRPARTAGPGPGRRPTGRPG